MLQPEPAVESEAPAVVALRDELARDLLARGLRQWHPGEVGVDEIRAQITHGEWHVARDDGIVATLRLAWADPMIWDDLVVPGVDDAGYVHGLMVRPDRRGAGLGRFLLAWAEDRIRASGRRVARVDCVASNVRLRAYYRSQGYVERGVREFDNGWYPLMRFERPL